MRAKHDPSTQAVEESTIFRREGAGAAVMIFQKIISIHGLSHYSSLPENQLTTDIKTNHMVK